MGGVGSHMKSRALQQLQSDALPLAPSKTGASTECTIFTSCGTSRRELTIGYL